MTTSDPYDLTRFVTAQQDVYEQVLAELRRGRKTSHWMWFVFPQLAGLGQSPTARFFALSGLAEARAYLAHPVLGPRLAQCAQLVAECREPAARIFGHLDAQKLRSCVTLFLRADPDQPFLALVLDRHFGGVADPATDRLLDEG
jgi:uncharacterized protein (DUF1810 family)